MSQDLNWYITKSFTFDCFTNNPYACWCFSSFDEAIETAEVLVYSVGNVYIWKETQGNPIKWMEVKP